MELEDFEETIIDPSKSFHPLPQTTYEEKDYARPPLGEIDYSKDFVFMQTDIDHTI
jgi:hypothetical protein